MHIVEPWRLTEAEAARVVEKTREQARDPFDRVSLSFILASQAVAEKLGLPADVRSELQDVEYWDKRLSTGLQRLRSQLHITENLLRLHLPTATLAHDEAVSLLRDAAAVARALLMDHRHHGGDSDRLQPLLDRIESGLALAERKKATVHAADVYYVLEAALEANDERRLVLLPDAQVREEYLAATLDAVSKTSRLMAREFSHPVRSAR